MRKGVIDLDWLDGEIEKLRNKGANSKTEGKLDFREEKTLLKVLSKCTPIEEPQLGTIKENAWNTGFIGMKTRETSPLFQISPEDKNVGAMLPYDNKVTFSTSGANQSLVLSEENRKSKWTNATIEDVKQEPFLSKTCTNNWEDKKFCENTGKCELCKFKQ